MLREKEKRKKKKEKGNNRDKGRNKEVINKRVTEKVNEKRDTRGYEKKWKEK